jgi:acyl-CoA reductase-like NAD-dependent aldehyde dehydrogenase
MAASPEAVLDRELESINPETLEPVGSVVRTPPERVGELVAAATAAQARWAGASFAARARLLRTVRQVILERSEEIAATISAETGEPRLESITMELLVALDETSWLAGNLKRILRPERLRLSQLHLRHKRGRLVYEPTVLTGRASGSRLEHEEIFGPVVTVEPFDGEDEAVGRANGTTFGLAASVWTRDLERAQRVSTRLQAGMVWVNDFAYSFGVPQASWGGYKDSGVGRTRSKHGLYDCSQIKYADSDRGRRPVPWWFPYDDQLADGFRGVLHLLHDRGVAKRARAAWRYRAGLGRVARRYLGR